MINGDINITIVISEERILQKAKELFDVYQSTLNKEEDNYCKNFEYLQTKSQKGWIEVAKKVLTDEVK